MCQVRVLEGEGDRVPGAQPVGQRLGPSKTLTANAIPLHPHLPFPPPRRPGFVPQSIPKQPSGSALWNPSRGSPGTQNKVLPISIPTDGQGCHHRTCRRPSEAMGCFSIRGPGPKGVHRPSLVEGEELTVPEKEWNEGCQGPP